MHRYLLVLSALTLALLGHTAEQQTRQFTVADAAKAGFFVELAGGGSGCSYNAHLHAPVEFEGKQLLFSSIIEPSTWKLIARSTLEPDNKPGAIRAVMCVTRSDLANLQVLLSYGLKSGVVTHNYLVPLELP